MDEKGLTLAQVGQVKEQDVGGDVVHQQASAVLETDILRDLEDGGGRHGDQLSPGFVVRQRDHSVSHLHDT